MFKQRLLTTLFLVPLILLLLYQNNTMWIISLAYLIGILCAIEWLKLSPVRSKPYQLLFVLSVALANLFIPHIFTPWFIVSVLLWSGVFIAIFSFPRSQAIWGFSGIVTIFGFMFLPLFVESLIQIYIHPLGKQLLIALLIIVWSSDIGAYLCGKTFGKHRLIPNVSPGKTVEGSLGGLLITLLLGGLFGKFFLPIPIAHWLVIVFITTLVAMMGDLFISMLKRRVGIKDTGNLLPGHGGILDRLDSLVAAAPIYFGMLYFFARVLHDL